MNRTFAMTHISRRSTPLGRVGFVLAVLVQSYCCVVAAPAEDFKEITAGDAAARQWLQQVQAARQQTQSDPSRNASPAAKSPAAIQPTPLVTAIDLLRSAPAGASLTELTPPLRKEVALAVFNLQLVSEDIDGAVATLSANVNLLGNDTPALTSAVLRTWAHLFGSIDERPLANASVRRLLLPVTQTMRAHNMADLAALATALRQINGTAPDPAALVNAFVAVHGRDITYDANDLATIFGPPEKMDIESLLSLAATLRENLTSADQGLQAKNTEQAKAARQQIGDAYASISKLLRDRLGTSDDWRLQLSLGNTLFQYATFCQSSGFEAQEWAARRREAFAAFQAAANRFGASDANPSADNLYSQWFNCATGALDPLHAGGDPQPDPSELVRLRRQMSTLPYKLGTRQSERLADYILDTAQSVNPDFRQQYVRAGLIVVGGTAAGKPLERIAAYHDAVLAEVKLVSTIDGDVAVGINQLFGVCIALRHTDVLDREVGGFSRILRPRNVTFQPGTQPQTNLAGLIDYRTQFERDLRRAVESKLEVVNIVWADGKSLPIPATPAGWSETPLAYVLFKATDASVDAIPSFQLNLDFGDKGDVSRVTLPVVSVPVAIQPISLVARPYDVTSATELLDDRSPENGVRLEMKVTGHGLLPLVDRMLDSQVAGWTVQSVTDTGLLPDRYETAMPADKAAGPSLVSQRTCTILYTPVSPAGRRLSFAFPNFRSPFGTMPAIERQRYANGDLVPAEEVVQIALSSSTARTWIVAAAGILALLVAALVYWRPRKFTSPPQHAAVPRLPDTVTPFTATTFLRTLRKDVRRGPSLPIADDLDRAIAELEGCYYNTRDDELPGPTPDDLRALLGRFASEANRSAPTQHRRGR